jgi:hypothetical protein
MAMPLEIKPRVEVETFYFLASTVEAAGTSGRKTRLPRLSMAAAPAVPQPDRSAHRAPASDVEWRPISANLRKILQRNS